MIVEAMEWPAIKREIFEDFQMGNAKCTALSTKLRRAFLKTKKPQELVVPYTSKNRNEWTFYLKVTGKSMFHLAAYLKYETRFGPRYAVVHSDTDIKHIEDMWVVIFSGHFFKRRRERLGLSQQNLPDAVHNYIVNSTGAAIKRMEQPEKGIYKIMAADNDGFALGTQLTRHKVSFFNTFITKDMLHDSQVQNAHLVEATYERMEFRTGIS